MRTRHKLYYIVCVYTLIDGDTHTCLPQYRSYMDPGNLFIQIIIYVYTRADKLTLDIYIYIYICVCVFPNHFCTILPVHGYEKKQNPNSTTTTLDNVGSYGYRRRSPDPVDSSSRPCQARGSACGATENSAPRSRAKWKCFLTEQSRNGNGRQQR